MVAPFETMPGPEERIAIFSGSPEAALLAAMHTHGPTFRFFEPMAKKWMVASGDPAVAEHVLVTNAKAYKKGLFIGMVELLLGDGIMVSEGELWLAQRRIVQQAFHRAAIARALPLIRAQNELAARAWAEQASVAGKLDVTQLTSELTLNITLGFLFGDDLLRADGSVDAGPFSLLSRLSERDMSFRKAFLALATPPGEMIDRRRAKPGQDALSEIVRAAGPSADQGQLIAEAKTLIVAGHETTASAMAFFWLLLAQNPDAQGAVRAQAEAIATAQDPIALLERAGLVRQAIDETLRLYPPGWMLARRALQADAISEHQIPAGTDVLVSPFLIGHNPALWPEPDAFRPERFATSPARFTFIPFAAGPRQCVGDRLAMLELVAHAALMLPRLEVFELPAAPPVELEARINLLSSANIVLGARSR
jgi:enediyne biosynthesis protein E7